MTRLAPVLAIASLLLFVHTTYWREGCGDEWGSIDVRIWRAVGLSVRHGTLPHIYEVGQIDNPASWADCGLQRADPEVARMMRGWYGRPMTTPWLYLPPAAILCLPFGFVGHDVARYGWAVAQLVMWCWMWFRVSGRWGWFALAACPWLPGVQDALRSGSSTIALLFLCIHGGGIGVALAGWCKPFCWLAGVRSRGTWAAAGVLGLVGLVLAGASWDAWTGLVPLVRQMHELSGRGAPIWLTGAGMVACLALAWWRAPAAAIVAVGLCTSPVLWPHYVLAVWLAVAWMAREA